MLVILEQEENHKESDGRQDAPSDQICHHLDYSMLPGVQSAVRLIIVRVALGRRVSQRGHSLSARSTAASRNTIAVTVTALPAPVKDTACDAIRSKTRASFWKAPMASRTDPEPCPRALSALSSFAAAAQMR